MQINDENFYKVYLEHFFEYRWLDFYTTRILIAFIILEIIVLLLSLQSSSTYNRKIINILGITILIGLCIISIIGFILVYIYPKYIYLPVLDYKLTGKNLLIFDTFYHQLPLIIHLFLLMKNYWNVELKYLQYGIIFNLIYFIIYLLRINPFTIYLPLFNENVKSNVVNT